MHSDIHLIIHLYRADELRSHTPEFPMRGRAALRQRLGWTMIELGLRLARPAPAHRPRTA
ncbi:hypothetical protein AB0M42_30220 [Streptomyces sp. NPDC051784]|uniref:hypothetical protein n=1 Tax=Streptomyces sp. NPDC051784 TaxID=3155805 RepID=UPI003440B899